MYYPIYRMVHIKDILLVIGKSSLYRGSGFPLVICVVLNKVTPNVE